MLYGNPQVLIEEDVTDRIGIRTVVASQMWAPRAGSTSAEIAAQRPEVPGGIILVGEQTRPQGGVHKTFWTFEGIPGDGKSVTFKDRQTSRDFEFQPGFSQVTLKRHPKLAELMDTYQGHFEDGELVWNQFLDASSGSGLKRAAAKEGQSNPMFGEQDYFRLEGTYSFRYAVLSLSASLLTGVGKIATSLPGVPPPIGEGRNWLKAPPAYQGRGLVIEVMESYWLSGPGGWPEPIYGKSSNNAGSGLGAGAPSGGYTYDGLTLDQAITAVR